MKLPNFLIIGAHKAGTTSLYEYCKEHPEIYMSPLKETNFLAFPEDAVGEAGEQREQYPIKSLEEYQALFSQAGNAKAIGEASPAYLHSAVAIEKIERYVPNAKLVISLRNPIERSYSGYLMAVRDGNVSLKTECFNPDAVWVRNSLYYQSLKRYLASFDVNQIKIILFDDFKTDTMGVMRDIFSFLDIDKAFKPDISYRHNIGGIPRNKYYYAFYRYLRKQTLARKIIPKALQKLAVRAKDRNLLPTPPLSSDLRAALRGFFRQDILELQDLVQRDLSAWLSET